MLRSGILPHKQRAEILHKLQDAGIAYHAGPGDKKAAEKGKSDTKGKSETKKQRQGH